MLAYILRRMLYGGVTVLGVLLFLFLLFFTVTTPDDIAMRALGEKAVPEVIEQWKTNHGYNRPLWPWQDLRNNMLFEHYRSMLTFDFGRSDADDVPITQRLRAGIGPSLLLTVPLFVMGLLLGIVLSLFVAFFRETYIDSMGVFLCVLAMSVSILLYIVGAQYLIAKVLRWFPISGFDSDPRVVLRFLALPITVGLINGVGSDVRFYRTVFVEETNRDYVRTARAKGAGEGRIMMRHVLQNAMIPVLTRVVLAIPFLFTGSLLLEAFFGIPGLGSLTVDAIRGNDFATLRTMVFIGSLLFILGQILTDVSYALVDPRVRLVEVPEAHVLSNLFVAILAVGASAAGAFVARNRLWKAAARDLWRRRPIALIVVGIYVGVALLDSIAWVGGSDSGGDVVSQHKPKSVIDRIFAGTQEKSYSSPFADQEFYDQRPLAHPGTHPLGTDILGRDILYLVLKGARVALLIGGLTSLIAIPLALLFGISAGYFGGRIDDAVFFVMSTLASMPNLLLLIALIMAMGRGTVSVCIALGVTSWVGLCRVTRGETLKLRELDYVQAARALGVSELRIVFRHILPNLMHLVIITFVLMFSGLVLSEAILSWLGIGVDGSWGQMIDQARDELSRDPVIWWNLTAAGSALFGLLLAVNFVGDALRDILDPRTLREAP